MKKEIKVSYSFTKQQLQELPRSNIPLIVQMRNILNSAGFKFKDDGKPSAITNLNPKPIGILKRWEDDRSMITHYEQIY